MSSMRNRRKRSGGYSTCTLRATATTRYWQQVPQVSIAQTYLKIMNRFCEQFGLTPSSQSRIVAEGGEDKESDAMELLLFKGGGG